MMSNHLLLNKNSFGLKILLIVITILSSNPFAIKAFGNSITCNYKVKGALVSSITRNLPSQSITNESTIQYSVIFNTSVTGVDEHDFIIEKSGITGAKILNVSGSESNYIVTVHTGTGDGILHLD